MKKFFIVINDVQQGPFTLEELRQRDITSDVLVWAEGMTDWAPAWQVDDLKPILYGSTAAASAAASSAQGAVPPPPPHAPEQSSAAQSGTAEQSAGSYCARPSLDGAAAQPATAEQSAGSYCARPSLDGGATPPPAGPAQPPRRTHAGLVAVIIGAVVLILMAMTNPSKDEHEQVIADHVTQAIQKTTGDDLFGSMVGALFSHLSVPALLDNALQYHNFLFFSKTTINIGSGNRTTSVGIFGKVFTSDEEQIAAAISDALGGAQRPSGDGLTPNADSNTSTTTTTTTDPDGNTVTETETTTEQVDTTSAANAIARTIMSEVKKQVKKTVREQTDSLSGQKIEQFIDDALNFIKGL